MKIIIQTKKLGRSNDTFLSLSLSHHSQQNILNFLNVLIYETTTAETVTGSFILFCWMKRYIIPRETNLRYILQCILDESKTWDNNEWSLL